MGKIGRVDQRKTGLALIEEIPWGAHFCHFYETPQDFIDSSVPFLKAGLDSNESCLWVVPPSITEDDAWSAVGRAIPDVAAHRDSGAVEIRRNQQWYLTNGTLDLAKAKRRWNDKLGDALANGYEGLRVVSAAVELSARDWADFAAYEWLFNDWIANRRMTAVCGYSLGLSRAADMLDITRSHQFSTATRQGHWDVIETTAVKAAQGEIDRLNGALEERVAQGTEELKRVKGALEAEIAGRKRAESAMRRAQAELAHAGRVIAMGEMVASIAHELTQPLTAVLANAEACLRWLAQQPPEWTETRTAVERIVSSSHRAREVIQRIRTLVRKREPRVIALDINQIIREAATLMQGEIARHRLVLRLELASGLRNVVGVPVQLQQVVMNLVMNGVDAMSDTAVHDETRRELVLVSAASDCNEVIVEVRDTGAGLDVEHMAHLFEAFFSTKPYGMGMGLSISRSIIEAHGGRLWATANIGHGATFHFTLPTEPARSLPPTP